MAESLCVVRQCVKMESTKQIILEIRGGSFAATVEIMRLLSVLCADIDAITNTNVLYKIPPSVLHSVWL